MSTIKNIEYIANGIMNALTMSDDYSHENVEPKMIHCRTFAADALYAKSGLDEMLSRHPNYDKYEHRIVFSAEVERPADAAFAKTCLYRISEQLSAYYYGVPTSHFNTDQQSKLHALGSVISNYASSFCKPVVDEFLVERVKGYLNDAHIHEGTKTTRALVRLLYQYGVPKSKVCDLKNLPSESSEDINSKKQLETWRSAIMTHYANYADAMNPLAVPETVVLSVNPVDFLLMSNGYKWTSCHSILRGGCYQAGCASYAYDSTTMILYTVDQDVDEDSITNAAKLSRQLLFWNGDCLFPSRIYPQATDGDSEAYRVNRETAEKLIADCLGLPNLWYKVSDEGSRDCSFNTFGLHYPDYSYDCYHFKVYALSALRQEGISPNMEFTIGSSDAICCACGDTLDNEEHIFCDECIDSYFATCGECGCTIHDEDDAYRIESEDCYVCSDCLDRYYTRCDYCNEYYANGTFICVHGLRYDLYYCQSCLERAMDNGDVYYCDDCGEYFTSDRMVFTDDGYSLCDDCAEGYPRCEGCDELNYNNAAEWRDDANKYLCDKCYDEWRDKHLFACDSCGELFEDKDLVTVYDDDGDEISLCPDCYEVYKETHAENNEENNEEE